MASEGKIQTKPKILCLHGFRTSGAILKKQIEKWPTSVLNQFDFHFLDAPFPSSGPSEVEGIFDPPYFEWFRFSLVRLLILTPNFQILCKFTTYPLNFPHSLHHRTQTAMWMSRSAFNSSTVTCLSTDHSMDSSVSHR